MPPGVEASDWPGCLFANEGTNARFTDVPFSTMDRYEADATGVVEQLPFIKPKTREELGAMSPKPPNPFTVAATMVIANEEGQTATATVKVTNSSGQSSEGTVTFQTTQ